MRFRKKDKERHVGEWEKREGESCSGRPSGQWNCPRYGIPKASLWEREEEDIEAGPHTEIRSERRKDHGLRGLHG